MDPREHYCGRGAPDRRAHAHRRNAELRDDLAILAEWEAVSRDEPWYVQPERYGVGSARTLTAPLGQPKRPAHVSRSYYSL